MRVIVSSRYAVEIVDFHTGDIHLIRTASYEMLYYGISWNTENMFIARRDLKEGKCGIEVLDLDLEYIETMHYGDDRLSDLHQICWYDDHLWVMSSGNQSVVSISLDGQVHQNDLGGLEIGQDINHLNSIWFDDDRIYMTAHNMGVSDIWTLNYPEFALRDIMFSVGLGAHNVMSLCGEMYVLDSGRGEMASSNRSVQLFRNTYPRGLAVWRDRMFIGRSEHNTDRSQRDIERRGAVQQYIIACRKSKLNLEHIKTIELHHGHVHEVRLLDLPDKAHNGMMWKGEWGV